MLRATSRHYLLPILPRGRYMPIQSIRWVSHVVGELRLKLGQMERIHLIDEQELFKNKKKDFEKEL